MRQLSISVDIDKKEIQVSLKELNSRKESEFLYEKLDEIDKQDIYRWAQYHLGDLNPFKKKKNICTLKDDWKLKRQLDENSVVVLQPQLSINLKEYQDGIHCVARELEQEIQQGFAVQLIEQMQIDKRRFLSELDEVLCEHFGEDSKYIEEIITKIFPNKGLDEMVIDDLEMTMAEMHINLIKDIEHIPAEDPDFDINVKPEGYIPE